MSEIRNHHEQRMDQPAKVENAGIHNESHSQLDDFKKSKVDAVNQDGGQKGETGAKTLDFGMDDIYGGASKQGLGAGTSKGRFGLSGAEAAGAGDGAPIAGSDHKSSSPYGSLDLSIGKPAAANNGAATHGNDNPAGTPEQASNPNNPYGSLDTNAFPSNPSKAQDAPATPRASQSPKSDGTPPNPSDPVGYGQNQMDSSGRPLFEDGKHAKETSRVAKAIDEVGGALHQGVKIGEKVGEVLGPAAPFVKGAAGAAVEGAKKLGPIGTALEVGGVAQAVAEGHYAEAGSDVGRMVFTKAAAAGAAMVCSESGPGAAIAAVGANHYAGKLWDGVADGSITWKSTGQALESMGEKFIRLGDSPNLT